MVEALAHAVAHVGPCWGCQFCGVPCILPESHSNLASMVSMPPAGHFCLHKIRGRNVSRLQPHTCKPEQILQCPSKEPVTPQRAMGSCGNGKKFLEIHTGGRMEGLGYGLFRRWGDTD